AEETLERYREINLLYSIGDTISASLDPDEIPDLVLAEASRIIRADVGVVLLLDKDNLLSLQSGSGDFALQKWVTENIASFLASSFGIADPFILTADQLDTTSAAKVDSILGAPLKARERQVLGFVLLARLPGEDIFTADDEKLLVALAGQAAVAVQNARLFADVKSQRDAIAEMKNYMDNIFASIASGVITTDIEDLVTILNRAAEEILGVKANDTMGLNYRDALPELGAQIEGLVKKVKESDTSVVGYELNPVLPKRGLVALQLHLSPLKDNHKNTTGIAIVVDDLTERRKLEEQVRQVRGTFERYVAPRVVEQLLSDPTSVRLGGVRQNLTILFADIRGFTSFSENFEPEVLVEVLNRHLNVAAEAVLSEDGTLDKFMGDAVMAIFNAPLPQTNHALRAVRAALAMQKSITEMHCHMPENRRLSFGIGIVTGPGVVGNIGSTRLQNYTAIGDSVNLAFRFQGFAKANQVLLNTTAYNLVQDYVVSRELGYIQVKGHSEPDLAFEVLDLKAGV
ncbi:MAG: PAS domain S-box protein, partial [Anaerolineae bacterium]|nr:PAS domain S-box protein [Anaerolineae bacterium]